MEQLAFAFVVPISGIDALLKRQPETKVAVAVKKAIKAAEPTVHPVWPQLTIGVPNGEVAKYNANIAAINAVKALEAENRDPTDEERATLNRYSGWGSLGQKFADWQWRERIDALQGLVSDDEFDQIKSSVNNAHYTPQNVIDAMWQIVAGLGFKGGRILDPSAGTGFFIGAMPKAIAERSQVTAVEIDGVSAGICRKLYGKYGVKVIHQGLESAGLLDGMYDLAITNVPFGAYGVPDKKQLAYRNFHIHDWFFAKALDLVRPGGLVAFVTSAFTLDKHDSAVRRYLAGKARFVGAFRLPVTALKQVAGTEVTADVIVLQRYGAGVPEDGCAWTAVVDTKVDQQPATLNQWYVEHPDRIVGKLAWVHAQYQNTLGVQPVGNLDAAIRKQVSLFASVGQIYKAQGTAEREQKTETARKRVAFDGSEGSLLPGSYVARDDGSIWIKEAADLAATTLKGKSAERVAGLVAIRDEARELVAAQVSDTAGEAALIRLRGKLNTAYDTFVRKFGFIAEQANTRAMAGDPSLPLLLSLENRDGKTGKMVKADLFTRRTAGVPPRLEHCDNAADAVLAVLDDKGQLDLDAVAALLRLEPDAAKQRLLDEGLAFVNPKTGGVEQTDLYLSGNVRVKLQEAEAAGAAFEMNAKALREVVPEDLLPTDIDASLGAVWIPEDDYAAWITEALQLKDGPTYNEDVSVVHSASTGAWAVHAGAWKFWKTAGLVQYGTARVNAFDLIEMALNQQVPTIRDPDPIEPKKYVVNRDETLAARSKQDELKDAFAQWVWSDPERTQRLARTYNDAFNNIAPWEPKGGHLTLPGFTHFVKLREHQKNAVWRIIAGNRNALLAHVVGAGKTLTMVCAAMEMRRLGRIAKSMFVVPNNVLEQFAGEFVRAYPNANILVAGKKDFEGSKRQTLLARIATGDWDGVILTHSMFERIKLSDAYVAAYIRGVINDIEAELSGEGDHRDATFKELRRKLKVWQVRLERLSNNAAKDKLLSFEELGVDWLFVDEAHQFKNLFRFSRMTRVAGLPSANSQRAFDMLLKTRFVMHQRNEESGVVFATGTPVSNSMAEMWVMQHYLQPAALDAAGVGQFDAWATTFGKVVTAIELAPDGSGYRMNSRFAKFVNLPELIGMFAEVADVRTADMLSLPVPDVDRVTIAAKASEELKLYVEQLVERSERIHNGACRPDEDNMLKVTGDGRRAALDMRLIDPVVPADPAGKVALCAMQIAQDWKESEAMRGTQLVFCDLSTPGHGFNVYSDIRSRLVKMGLPEGEIAFIHDYESDKAKARLFADVRAGTIRVLLGSTQRMGMGTNVQDRLVALHHLDAPWRPSDVEQREGRGVRQGNTNARIKIYRYVTEGSFDAYMWQTLETKARFIAQVMSGNRGIRSAEDVELAALSYAEVKALASGNPKVLEKAGVDAEVAKLSILKTQFARTQWANRGKLVSLPPQIERTRSVLAALRGDAERATKALSERTLVVGGRRITDVKEMATVLEAKRKQIPFKAERDYDVEVGRFGEFEVSMSAEFAFGVKETLVSIVLRGNAEHTNPVPRTGSFIVDHMIAALESIPERIATVEGRIRRGEAELVALRKAIDAPFEHEAKLVEMVVRQKLLNIELGVFDHEHSGADAQDGSNGADAAKAA